MKERISCSDLMEIISDVGIGAALLSAGREILSVNRAGSDLLGVNGESGGRRITQYNHAGRRTLSDLQSAPGT